MLRYALLILSFVFLSGCGGSDPSFVRLGDYENDAGEAVVRFVIQQMPEVGKDVPKEYSIVKALDLRSTEMEFARRFSDTKLTFISRDVLTEQEETHFPLNPKSGLSPVMIQLARMKKLGHDHFEIEAAWAWKKSVERKRYDAVKDGSAWKVTEIATLERSIVN